MLLSAGRVALALAITTVVTCHAVAEEERGGAAPDEPAASAGEAGHGSIEARIGYYHNDDGGGNPFLDETETVIEPIVILDYNVTDRLALTATLSYDLVSSASIDRLSRYPEQSGA